MLIQKAILMGFCDLEEDTFLLANRIGKDLIEETSIGNENDLRELVKLDNMRSILLKWFLEHEDVFYELKAKDEATMKCIINEDMALKHEKSLSKLK